MGGIAQPTKDSLSCPRDAVKGFQSQTMIFLMCLLSSLNIVSARPRGNNRALRRSLTISCDVVQSGPGCARPCSIVKDYLHCGALLHMKALPTPAYPCT